jgi:hypothetical protein
MKQQFKSLLLCVLASMFLLLSCKKEAPQPKCSPIKGSYTTTNEVLSPPPMLQQRITGIGHSTHLGESKFVAISTVNLTTPPPFKLAGTATFYAANGDVFYTVFSGTSTPNSDGTSAVAFTHDITGGTGRFKQATGRFTGNAIADPKKPSGSVTYEGHICY